MRTKAVHRCLTILLILGSCAVGGAEASDPMIGIGSFVFEPLEGKPVRLHFYVPLAATEESPVVIVCHGLSRNADGLPGPLDE